MRQRRSLSAAPTIKDETAIELNDRSSSPPEYKVLILCLFFRIVNSLFVQTYFNPDEHWQALEVAHYITFGYGHLTWEWKEGIRSYLHPLVFAAFYKALAFFSIDSPWVMMRAPRLLQAIFAAFGDLYLYKFSRVLSGNIVAKWALFAVLTNWFMFYCITRTFSNCLETVLTVVSLYYWPSMRVSSGDLTSSSRKCALALAILSCAIRPTSAITWIYVGLLELFLTSEKLKFVFLEVVPIGGIILVLTFLLDHQLYGSWVIVPLNFLKFNFLSSGGDYYGTHPWHWYISQGFTVMLFSFLPFSIAGVITSKQWKISGLIAWVLGVYSLLGHKEFRFVLPVLPIALMFSGHCLDNLENGERKKKTKENPNRRINRFPKLKMAVAFLLVTNLPMALYMSMIHQRGAEDAMYYLSNEARENKVKNVLFLTPCHATPYYSMLHHDIPMRFLDCTPSQEKGVVDESDQFLMDPIGFAKELPKNWSAPSHIVLFDSQERALKNFLASHNYHETKRFFHSHFKVDRELQASIAIYASQGQET